MRLDDRSIVEHKKEWEDKGYALPGFDRAQVAEKTRKEPFWVHFGAGNIFRAFQANVVQNLIREGVLDRGLIVVEGYDHEIIEKIYRPYDDLGILVTLKADGGVEKTVVASVMESHVLDAAKEEEQRRLSEIFTKDSLQMVSFTITEKGYQTTDAKGELLPAIKQDILAGPEKAESYLGKVAALLYKRYLNNEKPIAMVSMDNCSHNGDKLYAAMAAFADGWSAGGLTEKGFADYIRDRGKVSFPWTMIDKITPRPDASIEEILAKDGVEARTPIITSKNTYIAPFVNAEECEYLVIEDVFPNGRPNLEKGGLLFTDRETVDKVEKMKVCTCLNPLHTTLAVFGCLLGYDKISEEMKDPELKKLVEIIGYREGLPVVSDPGILDPKEFIDTVLNVRIPNPFMPDTPQRIATDTSQKLAIRFGETIKAYAASGSRDVSELQMIPLVFAGWLRYLMAVDDEGNAFSLSPDPLLDEVCPYLKKVRFGMGEEADEMIRPVLEKQTIFGVDLYENGMAQRVCGYFRELTAGPGAVRATLKKYLENE
ncbi:MAG: mannitol dehydrogenase family protein [Bacteroidales bacterium]|nr:mannitol dehydrogenase family protein [Bacteroidales bacterium]MCM1415919.1 mannitol dehydrogenase family protein [bacterium]MCM1422661.1 mannitol dehydrogenase family protein [bacterium]